MSEEKKNEELQKEVEATDVVTEEKETEQTPEDAQNEALQKALERAEDLENKYLRAHAEMQNIQRRSYFCQFQMQFAKLRCLIATVFNCQFFSLKPTFDIT